MRNLRIFLSEQLLRLSRFTFHEKCGCPECNGASCGDICFVNDRFYDGDKTAGFMCRYCGNGHYYG